MEDAQSDLQGLALKAYNQCHMETSIKEPRTMGSGNLQQCVECSGPAVPFIKGERNNAEN